MNPISTFTKIAKRARRRFDRQSIARSYHERFGREEKLLAGIDLANSSGLEFGPLDKPLVKRPPFRIKYLDHCSTSELRQRFAHDPNVVADNLCEVDFVVKGASFLDTVDEKFDYVLASHVFEHLPNPIGWMKDVATLLRPGGVLVLAIPDRRFTFDILRPPTTLGELIESHVQDRKKPSFANVFDQNYFWRSIDVPSVVTGLQDPHKVEPPNSVEAALEYAKTSLEPNAYADVHCNLLADSEFLDLITVLRRLDLTPFSVARFFPCERYNNEFIVHLAVK